MIKNLLIIALLATVVFSNVSPHPEPIVTHIPLTYKVNVEDPPMTRWAPIINDYQKPLLEFLTFFYSTMPFPKTFFEGVQWYARNEFKYKDFVAEIDAISKLLDYPFEKVFFLNFMYEFSTINACTGVIVRNDEGKIMHGRNLDFNFQQYISNLAVNVEYYKDGKHFFTIDSIAGSVLTLTGSKPGGFSVEVNTRSQKHLQDDFINVLLKNAIPTCWLLRKVVEEQSTFDSAVQRLKTTRIGGPVYYVVSGLKGNEGVVIERDNDAIHGFYQLTDENWFIVQTNYDRDIPDPVHDQRRIPAQNRLKERGNKGLTEQDLFDTIMKRNPTFNLGTILTAVMVSATGYHNTTVWYGENPKISEQNLLSQ